jgi:hypothetical protein
VESGYLFRVKNNSGIYRAVSVDKDAGCGGCAAYGKQGLCSKMPYCYGDSPFQFRRLADLEARKAVKSKKIIENFES